MKYALVVGHDSKRKGSYGNEGVSEFNFWDNFVNAITIPDGDECYVLYRPADIDSYTQQMAHVHQQMKDIGVEFGVELHFNGYSDPRVNGNEVLYNGANVKSIALAKLLDSCFDELPNRDRGIKVLTKGDNGFGFVAGSYIPCIISEPFFGSHQSNFIYGGKDREALLNAFNTFLRKVK